MIGVITSESGIPVLVTESDETHLGKPDDGKMNGGNGRGTLKDWVSSMVLAWKIGTLFHLIAPSIYTFDLFI